MKLFGKKKSGYVLALGGGGARGLAHIGVLKVLQQERIAVNAVVGTSMGSVIGAMFSHYGDAIEVEEMFRKFLASPFHEKYARAFFLLSENPDALRQPEKTVAKLGKRFLYLKAASMRAVFSRGILDEAFRYLLPDITFDGLEIPFACVATDIRNGEEVVLSSGKVLPAIIASSSIPGFVEPAVLGRHTLVDGSTTSTVPVKAARDKFGGTVIAVDVSMENRRDDPPDTAVDTAILAGEITNRRLTEFQLAAADVVIHPQVGRTTWANFDKLDEMIAAGEKAARRAVSRLIGRK